jgi:hypothetical protein
MWLIKVSGIDSTIVLRYFDDVTLTYSLIDFLLNAIKYITNKPQSRKTPCKLEDFLFISRIEEVISKASLGGSSTWLLLLRNRM